MRLLLIPVLSGYVVKEDEKEGWKAIGTFINVTFIATIIFCIFGMIFAPQLVNVLGTAFSGRKDKFDYQINQNSVSIQ